jgi:hypothetical protein
MCDNCSSPDAPLPQRIAEYHEIPIELAVNIVQHALGCENDGCKYGLMVDRHINELMSELVPNEFDLLRQIAQKAADSVNHQIRIERLNGRFNPERITELTRNAEEAVRAEFNLVIQSRREGK